MSRRCVAVARGAYHVAFIAAGVATGAVTAIVAWTWFWMPLVTFRRVE